MPNVSLKPADWQVYFSPGTGAPSNAVKLDIPIGNGTENGNQLDYWRTDQGVVNFAPQVGHIVRATLAIELPPGSVIRQYAEPGQDPNAPATCGLYLERKNLNLNQPNHRYWANNARITMAHGLFYQEVPLTQGHWTNVFGQFEQAGFADLLANLGKVGYTFGGGNDFGHGVYVESGSCRVTCIRYQFDNG